MPIDLCFEVFMYKCVKKMLILFSKIIKDNIKINNKNKNDIHIYYLVIKFYIYHLGISCDIKYSLLPHVDFNYKWLIRDIKNTLSYDIDEDVINKEFQKLSKIVFNKLGEFKCDGKDEWEV